jgi:hypothetical protein
MQNEEKNDAEFWDWFKTLNQHDKYHLEGK